MKKAALAFYFLSVAFAATAQNKVIFRDNFRNNRHKWDTFSNEEFHVQIAGKGLSFEKKSRNKANNYCLWYEKTIPRLSTSENFTISFYAEIMSADDVSNGFDFQWGKKEENNNTDQINPELFQLDFTLTGVRLSKFKNGWEYFERIGYRNADSSFSLQYGIKYKIDIIQKSRTLSVKVNNMIVYSKEIEPQPGHSIGVQQCLKGKWKMSKLRIRQDIYHPIYL